jgi:hypothetical protein
MVLFKGNLLQQRIGLAQQSVSWKEATVPAYKSFSIDVHVTLPQLQAAQAQEQVSRRNGAWSIAIHPDP